MAQLETLDAFDDALVVRAAAPVGGEIAAHQQPLAQEIVVRPRHAKREFGLNGDRRPAAAHGDIAVAERSFPDPLRCAFVIGRLVRQRERCRGARLRRGCCCGRLCRCGMRRWISGRCRRLGRVRRYGS
jgi:hypothetical protein